MKLEEFTTASDEFKKNKTDGLVEYLNKYPEADEKVYVEELLFDASRAYSTAVLNSNLRIKIKEIKRYELLLKKWKSDIDIRVKEGTGKSFSGGSKLKSEELYLLFYLLRQVKIINPKIDNTAYGHLFQSLTNYSHEGFRKKLSKKTLSDITDSIEDYEILIKELIELKELLEKEVEDIKKLKTTKKSKK